VRCCVPITVLTRGRSRNVEWSVPMRRDPFHRRRFLRLRRWNGCARDRRPRDRARNRRQREANHRKAAVGLACTFVEEPCCICDFGLGLLGVECIAKGFGVGNVVCDLAMIEVCGEKAAKPDSANRVQKAFIVSFSPHQAWRTNTALPLLAGGWRGSRRVGHMAFASPRIALALVLLPIK
jgi:hypothetical protein